MHRGRSNDRTDGNVAIGTVNVQLVTDPTVPMALAVSLDAVVALGWQFG